MIGLEKCCITSAYLQWLCHSGEQAVARRPLVFISFQKHVLWVLIKVLLMSTQNICFLGEIRKISIWIHPSYLELLVYDALLT